MPIKTIGRFAYDGTEAAAVSEGGNVPYTTSTVEGGCVEGAGNGVVRIARAGVYRVSVNATLEATAAGAVGLRLVHDGEGVPGASGAATLAAVGDLANVAFATVVTVRCCADDSLSVRADAATSVAAAALVVERVA